MARRKEKPGLMLSFDGARVSPASGFDAEQLQAFPAGTRFLAEPTPRLSDPVRRKYWATLNDVVKATGIRPTSEALHEAMKWLLSRVDVTYDLIGRPRLVTQSMAAWNDAEMSAYFDEAMAKLSELVGFDVLSDDVREAAE
jgi:hypothetical protein